MLRALHYSSDNYVSNSLRGSSDWRMIDCNVPILISGWSGTGTVMVRSSTFFCITT